MLRVDLFTEDERVHLKCKNKLRLWSKDVSQVYIILEKKKDFSS